MVQCDGGFLQIDTGYEKDYEAYKRNLAELKIPVSAIRYVFLTHHHDDHAGFLNDISKDTDCRIIAHELSYDLLKSGENDKSRGGGYVNRFIKVVADIKMFFDKEWTLSFPPFELKETDILVNGDNKTVLRDIGIDGTIVYTPGHCIDHLSLVMDNGICFCGDAAANFLLWAGTKYNTVFMTNMEQGYQSWQKMIDAGTELLYPSHGKPFSVNKLVQNTGRIKTSDLVKFF